MIEQIFEMLLLKNGFHIFRDRHLICLNGKCSDFLNEKYRDFFVMRAEKNIINFYSPTKINGANKFWNYELTFKEAWNVICKNEKIIKEYINEKK